MDRKALLLMRWKNKPPNSNWGEFGPDDQRGRMNYVTREKVLEGIAEVKEGRTFCLSLPLDYPGGNKLNPRRHPPTLQPTVREGRPNMNFPMRSLDSKWTDVICDDAVFMHLQYSTQWDSLAHVRVAPLAVRGRAGTLGWHRLDHGTGIVTNH